MMPLWVVAALTVAGGLGAATRFLLHTLMGDRLRRFPIATLVINVTGSFVIGLVTSLAAAQLLDPEWRVILGVGFLGGYTTFSAASYETVRLALERRRWAAALHGFGMMIAALLAAGAGLWLGGALR